MSFALSSDVPQVAAVYVAGLDTAAQIATLHTAHGEVRVSLLDLPVGIQVGEALMDGPGGYTPALTPPVEVGAIILQAAIATIARICGVSTAEARIMAAELIARLQD